MRHVVFCALIVYQFDVPVPQDLAESMRKEATQILRRSGIELRWWDRRSTTDIPSFPQIYVMRFLGNCDAGSETKATRGAGPLAITHVSDGEVLPFSDVDCNRVRGTLGKARFWYPGHSDTVVGRALGRIAAHEIVHMATKSGAHGRHGVAQPSFTPEDLAGNDFELAPEDAYRVRNSSR